MNILKNDNEVKALKTSKEYMSSGYINYGLDEFRLSSDTIKEDFSFIGWAYLASRDTNDNRRVKIFLASEKNSYELEASTYLRKEIFYMNRDMVKGDNAKFGFGVSFSTIPIKDGLYKIGIYIEENPNEKGFIWIPQTYEKKNNKHFFNNNKLVENINALSSDKIQYSIDDIDIEKGILTGWIFKDGFNCDEQKVYIQIIKNNGERYTFDAISYGRIDSKLTTPIDMYINRGFKCFLPKDIILDSSSKIEVLVKTDKYEKAILPYLYRADANKKVAPIKAESSETIEYSVDYAGINAANPDAFEITGWIYKKGFDSQNQSVYVKLTDENGNVITYGAKLIARNGLVEYFGEKSLYSGYQCFVPTKEIKSNSYTIEVIVKTDKYEKAIVPYLYRADANN